MSRRPGGEKRCASATYAGRFVVSGYSCISMELETWQVTLSGNARQRRRRVREMRQAGGLINRGGVAA